MHTQAPGTPWPTRRALSCIKFPGRSTVESFLSSSKGMYGLPSWLNGEQSPDNAGDAGLIPGSGRFPWRREWHPL